MNWGKIAADLTDKLREERPLVHNITNLVVMNETANILLAVGALPVMAPAREEAAEMAATADAVVLNIGTLSPQLVDAMIEAGQSANEHGKPVILDPVGAGATALRTDSALRILKEVEIAVIRGNAAEVSILAGRQAGIRGVECVDGGREAVEVAKGAAAKYRTVVAVTGEEDVVTDGSRMALVRNGHHLMSRVTGTGCMASALTAAYSAVSTDRLAAAAAALAVFGLAGEKAAVTAAGPGSFHVNLYDELDGITAAEITEEARIESANVK